MLPFHSLITHCYFHKFLHKSFSFKVPLELHQQVCLVIHNSLIFLIPYPSGFWSYSFTAFAAFSGVYKSRCLRAIPCTPNQTNRNTCYIQAFSCRILQSRAIIQTHRISRLLCTENATHNNIQQTHAGAKEMTISFFRGSKNFKFLCSKSRIPSLVWWTGKPKFVTKCPFYVLEGVI